MPKECHGPAGSLPLSAAALGDIRHDGRPREREERIRQHGELISIDDALCYAQAVCSDERGNRVLHWVRLPAFFHRLSAETRGALPLVYQVNDLVPDSTGRVRLHAHYDPSTGKWHSPCLFDSQPAPPLTAGEQAELQRGEALLASGAQEEAAKALAAAGGAGRRHPRLLFACGALAFRLGDYTGAKRLFHHAAHLGHPDALQAEWQAVSMAGRPFRLSRRAAFAALQDGDFEKALELLRREPASCREALASAAYCLRRLGRHRECRDVCLAALHNDVCQSDLLAHLWAAHTALGDDQAAQATARLHLQLYPLNPQACLDALDSALLRQDFEQARRYALSYPAQTLNLNSALSGLFKYYDLRRDWRTLLQWYDALLPLLRAPIPQVLVEYGETLTELGRYDQALTALERALRAEPASALTALAYGRTLARSGDTDGAIRLIATVMHDWHRRDSSAEWLLLAAFLSELLRNTGNLPAALELWQCVGPLDTSSVAVAGIRPLVEYAYCLASAGRQAEATMFARFLHAEAADAYVVQELQTKLRAIGMRV